ncbi:hypothetical protein EJ03DRAFT_366098 [Teratosphaeria nubilosa]|uniref:Uncharacterized protein n=1 Tax=Teratosphaeria nubilosa TaxID=161662 RepID=A0A6G1L3M9_9PEZI|nr:hypothetical protein EJ03DRAFT_366098 [Teratosphaeria nubilosa]
MLGLPYQTPDHFCDLRIKPMSEINPGVWLYRKLVVMTGRVIDSVHHINGPRLSAALQLEEEMDEISAQLPPKCWDLADIQTCPDSKVKLVRLLRTVDFHQVRTNIHLPLMMQSALNERYRFSVSSCVNDSRHLLRVYLAINDTSQTATSNSGILNFTAMVAAVVLLLGLLGYGLPKPEFGAKTQDDWNIVLRTKEVVRTGKDGIAGSLCRQCSAALGALIQAVRATYIGQTQTVHLPYFGAIKIKREAPPSTDDNSTSSATAPKFARDAHASLSDGHSDNGYTYRIRDAPLDGLLLDYQGPLISNAPRSGEPWSDIDLAFDSSA